MKILSIPGDVKALVDELRIIRNRQKADKKRSEVITNKLKDVAENSPATLAFNKQIVAMIEAATSSTIDGDKLRADYPDIAAACTSTIEYLKVKCC